MRIPSLFKFYKERYHIPKADLSDTGETNRIHLMIISELIFLFGILNFLFVIIFNINNLLEKINKLIYFAIFIIVGIFNYIYSSKIKDIKREKAYLWKTIPTYILFYSFQGVALYNFYVLKQPFNGFVVFGLTSFIALCLFSISPMLFLLGIATATGIIAPGIYKIFGFSALADVILSEILLFCLALYKRRIEKKQLVFLKTQKKDLEAKTFGNFTLIYRNKIIKFSRTKSNELVGYLIYKNGSSVNSKELISVLWGDNADSSRYGNNLRNLIVDIKHSLKQLDIQNFFITEYNNFRINPEVVKCDYYDFLAGNKKAINSFAGEFMSQFSWAEETAAFLEMKIMKK